MKKIIIPTCAALMFALSATAQMKRVDTNTGIAVENTGISVTGQSIVLEGDEIAVQLDVAIGRRAARSGHTVVWRPFITDGSSRWALPEIVVQHRRARIAERRHNWAAGIETLFDDPTLALNGEKVQYTARVPYQHWMGGAELIVETLDMGCCGSDTGAALLAYDLPTKPLPVLPEPEPEPQPTTGELMTEPWVLPASQFSEQLMFDDDRDAALRVYFRWNDSVLDLDYEQNAGILARLMEVIATLENSDDSRVAQIVVAGFASPEGPFDLNDRLAYNRATALKEYIAGHSGIDDERIHIYNGAEDWVGLRQMVEASDMEHKQDILDVIDSVPISSDGRTRDRERILSRLAGGVPWRVMTRDFFPELRKAAYIKVFYENK